MTAKHLFKSLAAAMLAASALATAQAADVQLINIDGPGVGFNDPTPAAPVGGNPGTTLGEQRQAIFSFVADFWGKRLQSGVPIQVLATFDALPCTATSATLGAAGAYNIFRDFPNAQKTGTWYSSALANKLAGAPLIDNPDPFESADIVSFFNGNLGKAGCLDGVSFYLGLDGKAAPNQIDLVTTVLHEFGHGLGFQTFTRGNTGLQLGATAASPDTGFPSIWDYNLYDPQLRKNWAEMTVQERIKSAITPRNLVWNGQRVQRNAAKVLERGTPELFVAGKGLNKFFTIGTAQFGPPIDERSVTAAELSRVNDQADGRGLACTPLDAKNAAAVKNRVAIIDRGTCAFTVKVKNAQDAGAKAVIIADNAPGGPPQNLSGTDAAIVIPAVRVTLADGTELKAAADAVVKPALGPFGVFFENPFKLNGADYFARPYLYTPDPFRSGSSVSHYDTSAKPNLLMEPFAEPNQPIAVSAPLDLTLELLKDTGW
jgi:PA domain